MAPPQNPLLGLHLELLDQVVEAAALHLQRVEPFPLLLRPQLLSGRLRPQLRRLRLLQPQRLLRRPQLRLRGGG